MRITYRDIISFAEKAGRKWGYWLLTVTLLLLKCYVFDCLVTETATVSWESTDMYVRLAATVIIATPVLLTTYRFAIFVILTLADVWMIVNVIYYRAYQLFFTWHLFALTKNMDGFWDSIIPYFSYSLLLFPLLTLPALVCFMWKNERARWYEIGIAILIGMLLSVSGSIDRWKKLKAYAEDQPLTWEWINPCDVPQALSAHISENERQTAIYIRHHSILSYPLYMVHDAINKRHRSKPEPLTEEEENELQQLLRPVVPASPVRSNLLIILAESFESWLLDVSDANGFPICPSLYEYVHTHPALYVKDVSTQIAYGMSGDGQLIANTGLYPTLEGVACIDYGDNVYPNIAHFYPSSAVVNPCKNVWNQTMVTFSYGYRQLVEPKEDRRFAWNDSIVADKVIETFSSLPSPACVMAITISGHIPFDSHPDDINIPDSVPVLFKQYMQTAHYTDRQIGRILAWADTAQIMQGSTIVVTGDHRIFHAWMNDDIRDYGLRAHLPFGTGQAGCPLIITSPAIDSLRVMEQAHQVDIYPTILGLIGQKDYYWQGFGKDLLEIDNKIDDRAALHRSLSDKLIRMNYFKQ